MDYGITPQGYRLPAELRLGTVTLQVTDVQRSVDFYSGLLGMRIISSSDARVVLGTAGSDEPLLALQQSADRSARRRGRLGLYHFAVLLPDRPALGRLLNHLVRSGVQPGAADHLVSEALYLQDPDDLGIEIYRDRPRAEWTTRGRQLAMSSDPIDKHGIMAAAQAEPWSGMPAATRIGHVHLHVGSVDDARAFYHDALGFDVIVWSYPGALFMSAGGYHHHLGVNTWAGPHAAAPAADEPRLISWDIVLPSASDVAAAARSVQERGYAASAEEPGGSIVGDPWGTQARVRAEK